MGDLLLGADFNNSVLPGWEVLNRERLNFRQGNPAELHTDFEAHTHSYYVMKSSGLLDNFDVGVTLRYLSGHKEYIRAGLYTRFTSEGGYAFMISAQASYKFGLFNKDSKGELTFKDLLPWTTHTALRDGYNQPNRLRVICRGDNFRVYLNGVLAASFQDEAYRMGKVYVVVEPGEKSGMETVFSDLQVREAPRA